MSEQGTTIRVATFNVSMEALNYIPYEKDPKDKKPITGKELLHALKNQHQQIKNIAEIIQRTNPDIILINEFDRTTNDQQALKLFLNKYLAVNQQKEKAVNYPYFYQGSVNTGESTPFDLNNDGLKAKSPADNYGFGYFPGHYGMVLLSKYPINTKNIRTFQKFKWHDMPNALKPITPATGEPWYNEKAWQGLRLSSKSHWDIPIVINNKTIHVLASHPTPPVFDGPENRNGNRNHDEIRFWADYISQEKSTYIYDDNNQKGGLANKQAFIILGDQNASNKDGDAIYAGINMLLNNDKIQDPMPFSLGAKQHNPENNNAKHHTAYWGMRADYVLPSIDGFIIKNSGVFWPEKTTADYRLIKDRQASSDHRLVWVDLQLTDNK